MTPKVTEFIKAWVINTVAVLAATHIVSGVRYDTSTALLVATLVLGILNAFVKPVLMLLSLPLLLFTLGLFTLVINALLLYFVGYIVGGFHVETFWVACKAALVMAIINLVLNSLTHSGNARIHIQRGNPPGSSGAGKGGGKGPVIDV
jgi:putative membrane protein